ncbi:hypothetical protein FXO38_02899 [Capsicum annuum]|nr:hypothetical protein FXO38_02899 [Capsicum annuum]
MPSFVLHMYCFYSNVGIHRNELENMHLEARSDMVEWLEGCETTDDFEAGSLLVAFSTLQVLVRMKQAASLKKKVSNPNKAQSSLKNMNFVTQYRSSVELVKEYKIKREQIAKEHNDKIRKSQSPMTHKRKNLEESIAQQEKSILPINTSISQSSAREEINASHMITGKGQIKQRLFQPQSREPITKREVESPMHNFIFQGFSKVAVNTSDVIGISQVEQEKQHAIKDLENCKQVKRKSVLPSSSLDQFLEKQGIHISGGKEHDIDTIDGVTVLPTEDLNEHNKRLDDPAEQEEIGEDGWLNSDDDMNVDCGTNDEREVVTFDLGEAVGPTDKAVSNLSNFIGTVARNPIFINLLYTSWHAVPDETKKQMWDYVNSKFLIPKEGQKWVMHGLRDAWRGFKREVKRRCFDKRLTVEEMLEKRPAGRSGCSLMSRRTKENNEEPLKAEMFVATRTKTGKEVQADTQIAISELENHQNAGKTPDDTFTAVFGKEKPGRVRGYGRSVTRTSLQKEEEMNELKQKHANEVTSMKEEIISEMRQEMRQFFSQLVQNNPGLNFQDILGSDGSNILSPDTSNAQAIRGKNLSKSSGSAHASVHEKVLYLRNSQEV